jgi:capsular exopolysaccharide synthesis family protein
MLTEPQSQAAEAVRLLATNIDFVNLDREARTIMITSAQRAEGKSTTAANLAAAFARTGRQVVLVDLDLRNPRLDVLFGLEGRPGLTEVVLGRSSLYEALAPIPIVDQGTQSRDGNGSVAGVLEVLTSGRLPPNAAEFMSLRGLTDVIEQTAERADIVVVDSPPLLGLSDTMTLTSRVDAVVVVAKLSEMRQSLLEELSRVLAGAPVVKLGFVLTGTDHDDRYGAGYGYAYPNARPVNRGERIS